MLDHFLSAVTSNMLAVADRQENEEGQKNNPDNPTCPVKYFGEISEANLTGVNPVRDLFNIIRIHSSMYIPKSLAQT